MGVGADLAGHQDHTVGVPRLVSRVLSEQGAAVANRVNGVIGEMDSAIVNNLVLVIKGDNGSVVDQHRCLLV
jgi:hypothetical protein